VTWIETLQPGPDQPDLVAALGRAVAGYPFDYSPAGQERMQVPAAVASDSIVMSMSLIPPALQAFFSGFGALLDPSLPLSRREHELIAATVSAINSCFY
jgi:hypothetical protein